MEVDQYILSFRFQFATRLRRQLAVVCSEGQFNTIIYERRDSYPMTADRWVVMMHDADMEHRGLSEGDTVTLASAQGRMRGLRVQAYDLPPGNLMAYFPEANVLTSTAVDPRSTAPAFKSTTVWLEQGIQQWW